MIVDVLSQLADWLRDVDEGYGAIRADVPRDPNTDPPPECIIVCAAEKDAGWAARAELPREVLKKGPHLVIRVADTLDGAFSPIDGARQAQVPVAVIYAAIGDRTAYEQRHAMNALRVVQRVFALKFKAALPAEIDRNGTKIQAPEGVTYVPFLENQADTVIASALVFGVPCDDPWATGAIPAP